MAILRGCEKFNAWQPQLEVVGVDGQPGQASLPQVASYPRISADRECFRPCRGLLPTALQMTESGKVCKVSEEAVIEGTQLVFYDGEWTSDGEPVRSLLFDVRSENDQS